MNCTVDYSVMGSVVNTCGRSLSEFGLIPFALLLLVLVIFIVVASSLSNDKESKRHASPAPAKAAPQSEDLPALVPVEASVSLVASPVVAVVEPAPVPVVDPAIGWSKPVELPADVEVPALVRKMGITALECDKFFDHADWLKFCDVRRQEMLSGSGHLTDAWAFFGCPRVRLLSISKRPAPVPALAEPLVCL